MSTPLWPQANGEVERQNRSPLKSIRIAQAWGKDWQEPLKFLVVYRSTPHMTTGMTPAQLFFRCEICNKIPTVTGGCTMTQEDRQACDNNGIPNKKGKGQCRKKGGMQKKAI